MSDQNFFNPSKPPKSSAADVRLYERVRLQTFRNLLYGSPTISYPDESPGGLASTSSTPAVRARTPWKHSRVLLEDFLKAEVLSSQLVFAIEDLVKRLQRMIDTGQDSSEDNGMSTATEDESIKSFRSVLAQSAQTLDELTRLRISESYSKDAMDGKANENSSLFENTSSMSEAQPNQVEQDENSAQTENQAQTMPQQRLVQYSSDSTTTAEKSSLLSERPNGSTSTTSPSDTTAREDDTMRGPGEEKSEGDVISSLEESVKTLQNEITELQAKHEEQFITFASKTMEFEQDDERSVRRVLERILQKLSPLDPNWSFVGRLQDVDMEQLFYFVLLQKTLRSCLAAMSGIIPRRIDSKDMQARETKEIDSSRSIPSSESATQVCTQCSRGIKDLEPPARKPDEQIGNNSLLEPLRHDPPYHSSDSNEEGRNNGSPLSKTTGKRPHEFEDDEHPNKKRKKGRNLFSCFGARWSKRNKRNKNK